MAPLWYTASASFFTFLVGKTPNIPTKYGFPIRTTKICLFSVPVIFPVPRRRIIKICEKILRNYESHGPFLDTINSLFFPLGASIFSPFYSDLFTYLGHYNLSNISYHILYIVSGLVWYTLTEKIRFRIYFPNTTPPIFQPNHNKFFLSGLYWAKA